MKVQDKTPLEWATLDELISELNSRYPAMLWIGVQEAKNQPSLDQILWVTDGPIDMKVRLAQVLMADIIKEHNSQGGQDSNA